MKKLIILSLFLAGSVFAQVAAPPVSLSNWSTSNTVLALADPNANKLLMWDDALNKYAFVTLGTNLSFTGTTLNAASGGYTPPTGTGFAHVTGGVQDGASIAEVGAGSVVRDGGDTTGFTINKRVAAVNMKVATTTDVYTVPAGKSAVVSSVQQITTAATAITGHAIWKLVESGAAGTMLPSTTTAAAQETLNNAAYVIQGGGSTVCATGNKIQLSITTAAIGTTYTSDFIVMIQIY